MNSTKGESFTVKPYYDRLTAPSQCKTAPAARASHHWQYHRPAVDYQLTITASICFILSDMHSM